MEPLLLPIPDACRALGVGRSKLYQLISTGDLSIRKIGRKTLVPREELIAFTARLASKSVEAA